MASEYDQIKIIDDDTKLKCYYQYHNDEKLLLDYDDEIQKAIIYPVCTRIGSPRFLKPKYGINNFIFEGFDIGIEEREPDIHVLSGLPKVFIKTLEHGLGLKRAYKYIAEIAMPLNCQSLIISKTKETGFDGKNIIINDTDLDKIRRGIDRISKHYSSESVESKRLFVHNGLLHTIDKDKFPEKKKPARGDVIYRMVKDIDLNKSMSNTNKNALKEIKDSVDLSIFSAAKDEFDKLIEKNHKEPACQKFFEKYPWLLTLFAGSSYILFQNQAYLGGKALDNKGGQYTDFLYRHNLTNNAFIIELKRPETQLLESKPYRKTGVYAPSKELSGAVSQALTQKYQLEQNNATLKSDIDDSIETYNVQSLIIIGLLRELDGNDQKAKKRSLELFRNNQKNIRIMTYDECQEQLSVFLNALKSGTQ